MKALYLADKSALARMTSKTVQDRLGPLIEDGELATCGIVELEVLFSARNGEAHARIRRRRELAYKSVPIENAHFCRALDVQGELARSGRHRLPIPDLLIAAAAEAAGLTVLHYDADFDTIASVTSQPVEWVVPRGSVP